jgi:hypothetical protein
MLNTNVLQLFTSLKTDTFVNNIQQRGSANVYNINDNIIIKINVVL